MATSAAAQIKLKLNHVLLVSQLYSTYSHHLHGKHAEQRNRGSDFQSAVNSKFSNETRESPRRFRTERCPVSESSLRYASAAKRAPFFDPRRQSHSTVVGKYVAIQWVQSGS